MPKIFLHIVLSILDFLVFPIKYLTIKHAPETSTLHGNMIALK